MIVELIDERGEELLDDQITDDSVAMFTKILKNILFEILIWDLTKQGTLHLVALCRA